jgi:hypothetical protein
MAAMDRVSAAPRCDSYFSQRFATLQAVAQRYKITDPDIIGLVRGGPFLRSSDVRIYGNILIHRSSEHEKQGELDAALADGRKALHFADLLSASTQLPIETIAGEELGEHTARQLVPLLARTGHSEEAALVAADAAKWKRSREQRRRPWEFYERLEWAGLGIHASLAGIVLFGAAALGALLFLWLRRDETMEARSRYYGLACGIADAAPMLLLSCSIGLYAFWHPYAQVIHIAMTAPFAASSPSALDDLSWATRVPGMAPAWVQRLVVVQSGHLTYQGWLGLTAALCILACFFLYRLVMRRDEAAE